MRSVTAATPVINLFTHCFGCCTVERKEEADMIRRNSFRSNSSMGLSQKVTIRLLDDNEVIQVDFQSHHKGQFLMDFVCRQLNIAEKDYFGLRFVDSTKQRHWMDLGKSITKQLKDMTPYIICFRFKFYPGDPMQLKEEVTRYQLVLQLRRDLLHGRLHSPSLTEIATLSSYIVQSELGDYDPDIHLGNYVSEYELVARQSAELEEKVKDLHAVLKGVTPSEADIMFLKKAATLDTYGVDPHPVKDQQGEQLFLGINHSGISTFQGSRKLSHFKWSHITKLNYEAKMFIVHLSLSEDSRNRKKETAGFKCQSTKACKYLWRCAVEQRLFYTHTGFVVKRSGSAQEVGPVRGGGLFGSRFRYSGKVQKEILEDPGPLRAVDAVIQRTPLYRSLQRNKSRSFSQSPMQLGYGSLPRSNHSAPTNDMRIEDGLGNFSSSTSLPLSTLSSPFVPEHTLPVLETLEEDSSPAEEKGSKAKPFQSVNHDIKLKRANLGDANGVISELHISSDTAASTSKVSMLASDEICFHPLGCPRQITVGGSIASDTSGSSVAAYGKSLSTAGIKASLKKLGTAARPKLDVAIANGSVAWAKARKNFTRLRKSKQPEIPYKEHESVSVGDEKTEASQVFESDPETADLLPRTNGSVPSNIGEKTFEFAPSFGSEPLPPCEPGDIVNENPLRESKIDKVETPTSSIPPPLPEARKRNKGKSSKQGQIMLSIWKVFVVCVMCVLVALLFVAILAIELDIDICQKMRRIPEVELFQTEVYEPVKYFIRDKIHNISDKLTSHSD